MNGTDPYDSPEISTPEVADSTGDESLSARTVEPADQVDRQVDSPAPAPAAVEPAPVVGDPVEIALADALTKAAAAGRFDVVAQLAGELEARRKARTANVVDLAAEAARRGRR